VLVAEADDRALPRRVGKVERVLGELDPDDGRTGRALARQPTVLVVPDPMDA
jgi:hypothetical protein